MADARNISVCQCVDRLSAGASEDRCRVPRRLVNFGAGSLHAPGRTLPVSRLCGRQTIDGSVGADDPAVLSGDLLGPLAPRETGRSRCDAFGLLRLIGWRERELRPQNGIEPLPVRQKHYTLSKRRQTFVGKSLARRKTRVDAVNSPMRIVAIAMPSMSAAPFSAVGEETAPSRIAWQGGDPDPAKAVKWVHEGCAAFPVIDDEA